MHLLTGFCHCLSICTLLGTDERAVDTSGGERDATTGAQDRQQRPEHPGGKAVTKARFTSLNL